MSLELHILSLKMILCNEVKLTIAPCLIHLGLYGLRSDLCDITKHMDEPVLHELLDGSYKYCNINAEKGKKPPVVNENLFTSVRKAFSILPHNCATDSNDNRKSAPCLMKPSSSSSMSDCYHNGKDVDESASTAKVSLDVLVVFCL